MEIDFFAELRFSSFDEMNLTGHLVIAPIATTDALSPKTKFLLLILPELPDELVEFNIIY